MKSSKKIILGDAWFGWQAADLGIDTQDPQYLYIRAIAKTCDQIRRALPHAAAQNPFADLRNLPVLYQSLRPGLDSHVCLALTTLIQRIIAIVEHHGLDVEIA